MKIRDIRTTIIQVPTHTPIVWAGGRWNGLNNVLIEVETDEGLVGYGEALGRSAGSVEVVRTAIESARRVFLGQTIWDIEALIHRFYITWGHWDVLRRVGNLAFSGVEMALWDLIGKAHNAPIHRFFGGRLRDRIDFFYYVMKKDDIEEMAQDAARGAQAGHKVFYVKVGYGEAEDERIVQAIRTAIGPIGKIRIDAVDAWDVATAIRMVHRLAPYDLDWVEQPVPHWDVDGMARVRREVPVAVAAHQGVWTAFDVLEIIKKEAADVLVVEPLWNGGLLAYKKIAAMAETAGLKVCKHSLEFGLGTCASMHVSAGLPNLAAGSQIYTPQLTDDIVRSPSMALDHATLAVPEGPGIGVSLDFEKVAAFARNYQEQGECVSEEP